MSVVTSLIDGRAHMLRSSVYGTWKKSNPKEAAAIQLYWDGGSRPTTIKSEFGLALLCDADAYTEASVEPPLPAPVTGTIVAGNAAALQAAVDAAVTGDVLLVQPGTIRGQIHIWSGDLTRKFQVRGYDPANPPVFVGGAGAGLYCFYTEAPITIGPDLTFTSADGYGIGFRANTRDIVGGRVTGCNFFRNAISGLYQGTQAGRTHSGFQLDNCTATENGQRLDLDPHTPDGDGEHSYYIGGGEGITTGALVTDCVSYGQLHGQAFQGGGGLRNSTFQRCSAYAIRAYLTPSSYAGFGIFSSFMGTSGITFDNCYVEDCDGYAFKAIGGATGTVINSHWRSCALGGILNLTDGGGNGAV